jgi:type IV pilus assembly protein PilF
MTPFRRPALASLLFFAAFLGACVSNTAVETRQVSSSSPTDARRRAEAHTGLAGEYFQRGNLTVALSETRLALADDPGYAPAHNMQGLVYMQLREDAPARAAFEKALSLDPNNPEVLNNYGWFLCTLQSDAARGVELMVRAANDTRYATPEKAFLSAGLCMRRLSRNAEAEDYLRRAVLIRPDLLSGLINLASITYERGALKEAENYLGRYNRIGSPSLDSLVLGVKIARALKDSSTEQSYLQQLRRLYPEDPQARELLEARK